MQTQNDLQVGCDANHLNLPPDLQESSSIEMKTSYIIIISRVSIIKCVISLQEVV